MSNPPATEKKEIHRLFFDMEEKNSLFDIKIRNISIWVRLRKKIYRTICQQRDLESKAHTTAGDDSRSHLRALKLWGRNIAFQNPFLADSTKKVYYGHPRRKKLEDGLWWDIYCDPIHERENPSEYVHVEYPQVREHRTPAKTENLRYTDFIFYTGGIAERIPGLSVTLSKDEQKKVKKIEAAVKEAFDVELNLRSLVEEKLTHYRYKVPLYKLMLKRVDPDIAIVVVNYGRMNFITACKQLDIPVVELQHGVINRYHTGYHYPGDRENKLFPDYLLTWGKFWKNAVEFPISDDRIVNVGYPFLEKRYKEYRDVSSSDQILFISQGTIGKQLSKFALEVSEHPDIEHDIVYKLHPGEYDRWAEEYPWLVDADFEVIDSSEPPLYELFAQSCVQIGVGSTAIFEGLCFDLETFVYDCPGSSILESIVDEGAAQLVSSADELASTLGTDEVEFDREYYFEPNAIENTYRILERLASEGSARV